MSVRLLIVDDHDTVREGLTSVLGSTEIETSEAATGIEALGAVLNQRVDIVLLDVDMPDLDGLEVLSRIKQQRPDLPVLMHSCHDRIAYVERSMKLGAAGYVIKSPNTSKLLDAIRTVLAGGNVWTADQLRYSRM